MKEYMVVFKKKGLPFHDRNRIYAESHSAAIQTIRKHYGRGAVEIVSVRLADRWEQKKGMI